MRRVIPLLWPVAIMAALTLLQRLFLVEADSGKQWAVMAAWFGLCNWFLRSPKTRLVPAHQPQTTTAPPSARHTFRLRAQPRAGVHPGLATQISALDPLYIPIESLSGPRA
jgi:hypothetical protein